MMKPIMHLCIRDLDSLKLIFTEHLAELKVGLSSSPQKIICFNDSPSKMIKNVFYFNLKAFFVLKIFKHLYWVFGDVEKTA